MAIEKKARQLFRRYGMASHLSFEGGYSLQRIGTGNTFCLRRCHTVTTENCIDRYHVPVADAVTFTQALEIIRHAHGRIRVQATYGA